MIENDLAHIIMGEAGTCAPAAMLAIAWVYSRNKKFNGWSSNVSSSAVFMSLLWGYAPDITNGREFVFSNEDMRLTSVRRIIMARPPPLVFECKKGLKLFVY